MGDGVTPYRCQRRYSEERSDGALAGGGLHAVALLAEAITRATDYETLNKGCAFFGDDNGVGGLSDEAGKKRAEMNRRSRRAQTDGRRDVSQRRGRAKWSAHRRLRS